MATNKVWILKYVVGNPQVYSQVQTSEPLSRAEAMQGFGVIDARWRKWVEHKDDPSNVIAIGDVEWEWRETKCR